MVSGLLSWNLSRNVEYRNSLLTKTINRQIEHFFSIPTFAMHQMKGLLELEKSIYDHDKIDYELEVFLRSFDFFDQVLVLNNEGRVIHLYPFDKDILGNDLSRQPLYLNSSLEEIYWSPVFISSSTGKPALSISISFSQGVLVSQIDMAYLISLISEIEIENEGFSIITDKFGTIIVHPDHKLGEQRVNISNRSEVAQARNNYFGTFVVPWGEEKYICSTSPISQFNWILLVYQEYSEVYSLHRSIGFTIMTALIGALLISFVLSRIVSNRSLNPLFVLDKATREIARGRYNTFDWKSSYKELDSLADNFSRMLVSIKNRENEIEGLRNHLSNIIDSMPSLMTGVDNNFLINLWNRSMEKLTNLTCDQAMGQNIFKIFPPLIDQRDNIEKCINENMTIEVGKIRDFCDKGGQYYDVTIYPLVYQENRGAGIRIDNITTMVNTEIMMQQSEKLNSLGKLSAGISHDLNNMLTPILGYGELLREHLEKDDTGLVYSDQILESAERARNLVRQLLVFSKKQNLEYKILDVNSVLVEFQKLLVHSIPENIKMAYLYEEGMKKVKADKGQLEQVIMNLIINARDAMPGGGELNISTAQIFLDTPLEPGWDWKGPGDFIQITIKDTGQGMEPEIMSRIFEPFYSTKGNRGNGLGLSMVYGIIEQHKGYIRVKSQEGRGTTFKVYLPVSHDKEEIREIKRAGSKKLKRVEKLLLVEDDDTVRNMIELYLIKQGFQILTGVNGEEGFNQFQDNSSSIKLVITDIIMPIMNGRDMVLKMRESRPDIPVLYLSGYSDDLINPEDRQDRLSVFLEKPFKLEKLQEIINHFLKN